MLLDRFIKSLFIFRLFAAIYDILILLALIFLSIFIVLKLAIALSMFNVDDNFNNILPPVLIIFIVLVVCGLYYCYSWRLLGQTIGMRSWRIKVVTTGKQLPSYKLCVYRFLLLILCLASAGLLFLIVDSRGRLLFEKYSDCKLIRLKK